MFKIKHALLSVAYLLCGSNVWAGPIDLPQLSTADDPVYYVIMNSDFNLDSEYPGQWRYLTYNGYNRNRPMLLRVNDLTDASLWWVESANGSVRATDGVYLGSLGAKNETHAYVSNTFEGVYLSSRRQYNTNLCFFSQKESEAVWYIHPSPYDQWGCCISLDPGLEEGVTDHFWYYDKVALIGEDNFFLKCENQLNSDAILQDADFQKYVFYSYDDLLEIAEANGISVASYPYNAAQPGASFQKLLKAIDNAKATASAPTIATGKNYLVRNRRMGYYLNTDDKGQHLRAVSTPTIHSVWRYEDVGGAKLLVAKAGDGMTIRVTTSGSGSKKTATWDLTATNPFNATIVRSTDGDLRYVAFSTATSNDRFFSMNSKANDYAIYPLSTQDFASDWEFIEVPDLKAVDNPISAVQIREDCFYRIRNVARSVANYEHDGFTGGFLEDVDKLHADQAKTEEPNFIFDNVDAQNYHDGRLADFYSAEPDYTHASALWQFERIASGSTESESATGLLSPEHDIFVVRNANTGAYIAKTTKTVDGKSIFTETTNKKDAARIYFTDLIDGQIALNLYASTDGAGTDSNSGQFAASAQTDGYRAALTLENVKAKNTNAAWIILEAPTLDIQLPVTETDDNLEWGAYYFPFDVAPATDLYDAGLTPQFYYGTWLQETDPSTHDRVMYLNELVDVPANNPFVLRAPLDGSNQSYGTFPVYVYPKELGMTSVKSADIVNNQLIGLIEAEDLGAISDSERDSYFILQKNGSDEVKMLPTVAHYLYTNTAYTNKDKSGSDVETVSFKTYEDILTGVDEITTPDRDTDAVIYDLLGRRVLRPIAGVYIRNGKKIIIK